MSGNNKEINIVNMIEEYLNKIPLKTWQAACAVSPESNEVCGMLLAATGLVEVMEDGVVVDMSSDDDDYVAAYFAAAKNVK